MTLLDNAKANIKQFPIFFIAYGMTMILGVIIIMNYVTSASTEYLIAIVGLSNLFAICTFSAFILECMKKLLKNINNS